MVEQYGEDVVGIDVNQETSAQHRAAGRHVQDGNLTNPDFWSRIDRDTWCVEWILLAMPSYRANLKAARLAREWGFRGKIGATAKFADEAQELAEHGIDAVFNIYAEAGSGFAQHAKVLFTGGEKTGASPRS